MEYTTNKSEWEGDEPPTLSQISTHLLIGCEEAGILAPERSEPVVFVTHSMGGLLVKRSLRRSCDFAAYGLFAVQTKAIAFFGTPHAGSDLREARKYLANLFRPSAQARALDAHGPELLDLNEWYRENAPQRGIETLVFIETKPTKAGMVVKPAFADPGMNGVHPVPLDADHNEMIDLNARDELHFRRVLRCIREVAGGEDLGESLMRRESLEGKAEGGRSGGTSVVLATETKTYRIKLLKPLKEMSEEDEERLILRLAKVLGVPPDKVLAIVEYEEEDYS